MPATLSLPNDPTRLAVSRHEAARALNCSIQHIDDLCTQGKLKKITIGARRCAIVWQSLVKFVEEAAA
jgi:hypothetical protein